MNPEQRLSRATRVVPGTDIVGFVDTQSTNPWLVVHREDCPIFPANARRIPLEWRSTGREREAVEISISAWDRPKLLGDLLDVAYGFYEQGLYLDRVHADRSLDGTASIKLTLDAPTSSQVGMLQNKLKEFQERGRINSFETWQLLPGQKVLFAGRSSKQHKNPYTVEEIRKRSMFFGRAEELAKIMG